MKKLTTLCFILIIGASFTGCSTPSPVLPSTQNTPPPAPHFPASLNQTFELKLNQSAKLDMGSDQNFLLTPKKIIEDSRCPSEISGGTFNCVWAGQVLLSVEILEQSATPATIEISSMKPLIYRDITIHLKKVDPPKLVKRSAQGNTEELPIAPSDYLFSLEVQKNASTLQ